MELTRKKIFTAKKIAYCALFCAFGVGLPQLFHVFGIGAGQTFLPMHIPALVAGMVLGPIYGLVVGIISPIISCFATGMPTLVKMPFMVIEIGAYGFFSGLAFKFFSRFRKLDGLTIFVSLLTAQVMGRAVNALSVLFAVYVIGVASNVAKVASIWTSIVAGLIGIVIQWAIIPPLTTLLLKVTKLSDIKTEEVQENEAKEVQSE